MDIQHLKEFDYTLPFDLIDNLPPLIREAKTPPTSYKCAHKQGAFIRAVANDPRLVSAIKEILGDEIYLWGSSLVAAAPGHIHRYHVDAEHFHIKGVSVSIGLENCTENTKFYFMSHSDAIPVSPQELSRNPKERELFVKKAKEYDARADHVELTMRPGQCIIWKGRTWHSTENKSNKTRYSLILQYAVTVPGIPKTYDDPRVPLSDKKYDAIRID